MAARCGIDIVEIKRVKRMVKQSDVAQMQRIFTQQEWEYCQQKPSPEQSLAARFAVKEACLKLFPAETNRAELEFIDIEIIMDNHGAPGVYLSEKLKEILTRYALTRISVSMSHTANYACGVAMAD
jgi:holo-[acyl-carrier protein] synthase